MMRLPRCIGIAAMVLSTGNARFNSISVDRLERVPRYVV